MFLQYCRISLKLYCVDFCLSGFCAAADTQNFSEAISLQDANFSGAFLEDVIFHWETLKTATWFGENSMKKRGHIRIYVDRDVEEVLEEAAQLGVRNLEGLRSLLIFNPREEVTDWDF